MQSSKEYQEEIRKPSSAINGKKSRKTAEWERLEISLRKLEIQGNISCKDGHNKGQKWIKKQKRLRSGGKNTWKYYTKKRS